MRVMKNTNKLFSGLIIITLCLGLSMLFNKDASAETIEVTVEFTDTTYQADDIQTYLNMAKNDTENTYKITVPPGIYEIGKHGLHIYSNTNLYMDNVTIKKSSITAKGTMMTVGFPFLETQTYGVWQKSGGPGYYWGKYKRGSNIKIVGGTFDAGEEVSNATTLFNFSHVKNISFENVTFRYMPIEKTDKHMIEFAAAYNVDIIGCTFEGNKNCGEAVQLESAIEGVGNFPSKGPADGTKTSNVTLKNNYFKNFEYGFGTNHGCSKDIYKMIKIQNNTFENISKYAICTYNYVGSSITGNIVKKSSKHRFINYILKLGTKDYLKMKNNRIQ